MSAAGASAVVLLGRRITVRLEHIGVERQPLMIVDHVLESPNDLIAAACAAPFYIPEHTNYPGLNAPLPQSYCHTVATALRGPIEAAFGVSRWAFLKYFGFFALATTSADRATPIQRIPHHDSPDPNRLALVHYLCQGEFGGTGFFRHRRSGYESIDESREAPYVTIARRELATSSETRGYADANMVNYEQIGHSPAVFNRLIVYRSHVLHSALLNGGSCSDDPRRGRLTANGFIEAAPSA